MLGLGFCKLHFSGSPASWLAAFQPVLIGGPGRFITKRNEEGMFLSLPVFYFSFAASSRNSGTCINFSENLALPRCPSCTISEWVVYPEPSCTISFLISLAWEAAFLPLFISGLPHFLVLLPQPFQHLYNQYPVLNSLCLKHLKVFSVFLTRLELMY